MRNLFVQVWSLLVGLCVVTLSGCTLVGAVIGAASNHRAGPFISGGPEVLNDIDAGDSLTLVLQDGNSHTGAYMGKVLPHRDTLVRWAEERIPEPCSGRSDLYLGDSIRIVHEDHTTYTGVYLGATDKVLLVRSGDQKDPRVVPFQILSSIAWCSGRQSLQKPLEEAVQSGILEKPESVRLLSGEGWREFRRQSIREVWYQERSRNGVLIGAAIGAIIDVTLLTMAVKERLKSSGESSSSSSSRNDHTESISGCPFAFGWTGEDWRMEMECFSGSFFPTAQRTDWGRLEYTKPMDGTLRLWMRNLLPEVDHIDHLAVLRIEHDSDVEVYPTEDQRVFAAAPRPPLRAWNDKGRDILPLLNRHDDRFWSAMPRSPGEGGSLRRSMTCEFSSHPGADSVTLVVQVQNTAWGAHMQYAFFSLYGSAFPAFHEQCTRDSTARDTLYDAMRREGMLSVSLWNGRTWQDAGYIWETGLSTWRAVALRLDVSTASPGPLRLRFEGPAGIWMLGYVGIDEDREEELCIQRIEPQSVVSTVVATNPDVIQYEDGRHLRLDPGEEAEIIFEVPDKCTPSGRSVTWILESSGYYRMTVPDGQPPQTELITRILREPGAFAGWSDEKLWRSLERRYASGSMK